MGHFQHSDINTTLKKRSGKVKETLGAKRRLLRICLIEGICLPLISIARKKRGHSLNTIHVST